MSRNDPTLYDFANEEITKENDNLRAEILKLLTKNEELERELATAQREIEGLRHDAQYQRD